MMLSLILTIERLLESSLLYIPLIYSFIFGLKVRLGGIPRLLLGAITIYIVSIVCLLQYPASLVELSVTEILPQIAPFALVHVFIGIPLMYVGIGLRRYLKSK